MMKAVRGTWTSCNVFITIQGEEIGVCAFQDDVDTFKPLWPLKCFLLIDKEKIIYGVVEDLYQD